MHQRLVEGERIRDNAGIQRIEIDFVTHESLPILMVKALATKVFPILAALVRIVPQSA
jgi:hypothetical protein